MLTTRWRECFERVLLSHLHEAKQVRFVNSYGKLTNIGSGDITEEQVFVVGDSDQEEEIKGKKLFV
jgi:hypothetical protein